MALASSSFEAPDLPVSSYRQVVRCPRCSYLSHIIRYAWPGEHLWWNRCVKCWLRWV